MRSLFNWKRLRDISKSRCPSTMTSTRAVKHRCDQPFKKRPPAAEILRVIVVMDMKD